MFRTAARLFAICTIFVAGAPAYAEHATAYGAGLQTCRDYLASRNNGAPATVTFIDWLSGYFSAVNRTSKHRNNFLGLTDLNVVLERLDVNCSARPDLYFAEAASLLVYSAKPGPAAHSLAATSYGSADKACQRFVQARQQREFAYWAEYLHWMGGYLSGVNAVSLSTANVLGDTPLNDAIQWLDTYCSAHPEVAFVAAVDALVVGSHSGQIAATQTPFESR
jgi:hypothetical protein